LKTVLITKNSTNDDYESLFNTITGNNQKEEDDCFEIKSGLNRLKNLKKQPHQDTFLALENGLQDDVLSSKFGEVQIFKSENQKFLRNCPRFSSEFIILNLDVDTDSKFHSKASEFGCTGKIEMMCKNLVDQRTYTITAFDAAIYKKDVKNYIYGLSALRDGNPFVCKYFSSWKEGSIYFIQTESSENTLKKLFKASSPEDETIAQLVKEVLSGIEYMHSKGV
jgi:serine/threonine protein kinase